MNPSTALATVLVDELVRGGVRDVVLCPGSRSAPLAYAVHAADAAGRLRLHVRVDERSAAFLALGLAKGSGVPTVVMTTSGTAVANLYPAVLEAHHSGVPLIVLSADRPHELRGTSANQTTVQPGLFGGAVRHEVDLPAAEAVPGKQAWWRTTVCRALSAAAGARGGDPGPVHLNVAFREPLAPGSADWHESWVESLEGRGDGAPWVVVTPGEGGLDGRGGGSTARDPGAVARAVSPAGGVLAHVARTLVVVGSQRWPSDTVAVMSWACGRGYPVIAEPLGQIVPGALPGGPAVLRDATWVDAHAPERVIVVGRVTLARPVAALLRRPGLRVEVVSRDVAWADPGHVAQAVHPFGALEVDDDQGTPDQEWAQAWLEHARACQPAEPRWGSGAAVAAVLARSLPSPSTLVVGSSNPVRDLDARLDRSAVRDLVVVANRGLAGIDGMVSTAVGIALATPGRPAYALLGDLTMLHDTNGLLIGPSEPQPDLTIVVANDDGGGIFATLEYGRDEYSGQFDRIFRTRTGVDLAAVCAAHGVRHLRAESADALAAAARERPRGLTVVEVLTAAR